MPQEVPGRLWTLIFLTFRHYKGGRSSAKRTGRLYPRRNPWYSLSEAKSTSGHMVLSGMPQKKLSRSRGLAGPALLCGRFLPDTSRTFHRDLNPLKVVGFRYASSDSERVGGCGYCLPSEWQYCSQGLWCVISSRVIGKLAGRLGHGVLLPKFLYEDRARHRGMSFGEIPLRRLVF